MRIAAKAPIMLVLAALLSACATAAKEPSQKRAPAEQSERARIDAPAVINELYGAGCDVRRLRYAEGRHSSELEAECK